MPLSHRPEPTHASYGGGGVIGGGLTGAKSSRGCPSPFEIPIGMG